MRGGRAADRDIAGAGNARHLPGVVDRGCGARGVAGQKRQFLDPSAVGTPDNRAELEDLRGIARGIPDGVLGPPDDLPVVVRAGGEAVSTAERGQPLHHAVLPDESQAFVAGAGGRREERGAAPALSPRIGSVGLRNANDHPIRVFYWPHDAAVLESVGTPERAEIDDALFRPDHGMAIPAVFRQTRVTGHQAIVVDAVSAAG